MAGVVLGDTPTVRAIHSDVTACTSGDKARRAKGKGGGVGVWSSSELADLKETKAGEKKKEVNKKIIKEIQNQAKVKGEGESVERSRSVTTCISFLWMVCCVGEHAVHSYSNHRVQPVSVLLIPFSSLCQDPRHKTPCGRPLTSYRKH